MGRYSIAKRILCLCLSLPLLLALAACGSQQTAPPDEPDASPEVDTEATEVKAPDPEPEPEPEPEPPIPFTDVPEDASYYDTVVWAYENGIVSDGDTFEPDSACTRGQVITFIWRAIGSPEPQTEENPFSDISSSDWYYKSILWAYENNVVTGAVFNPDNSCTNGEALTFLWRAEGRPAAAVYNSTVALAASGEYYARPVAWADNNGMFDGMDSAFDPAAPCRRADIVTYLYWATELWTHTEEDKTVQAEYEQIVKDAHLYEAHGSGLIYADYVDVDGDGNIELLTFDSGENLIDDMDSILRGYRSYEVTTRVYANVDGHAEKVCEHTFEQFGSYGNTFYICRYDDHVCIRIEGTIRMSGPYDEFYIIENGTITLNEYLEEYVDYTKEQIGYRGTAGELTEAEYKASNEKYAHQKELFLNDFGSSPTGITAYDRGILPDRVTYMKDVYAAVLNGDFSFFAGTYTSEYGDDAIFDAGGTLTTSQWETEPVSITVSENGVICCLGPYKSVSELSLSGNEYQERYEIRPAGVGSIQNTQIWYSRFDDGGVDYYKVS